MLLPNDKEKEKIEADKTADTLVQERGCRVFQQAKIAKISSTKWQLHGLFLFHL